MTVQMHDTVPLDGSAASLADDFHVVVPEEAQGFSALTASALCAILMVLAPVATRAAPMPKGWWVEPSTWPLLCLTVAFIASAHQALKWWLRYQIAESKSEYWRRSLWAFGDLAASFEFAAYFCVYLIAVGYLGFAISSFIFMQFVIWRVGLRTWGWRLVAGLFVLGLVLLFRVGIQLWFPMAPFLESMPDWFVQNIAIYM